MACIGALKHLGLPLHRIVTADVWATDEIPAELPEVAEFKRKADQIILERYGIEVEHYSCHRLHGVEKDRVTFQDAFYAKKMNGKYAGDIYGFPTTKGHWCQKLKLRAMNSIPKRADISIQVLGIAADEHHRIKKHIVRPNVVLPLVELGWGEDYCGLWAQCNGLLSPSYGASFRDGCWFCPFQGVDQIRRLRRIHPDLWAVLLNWDADSKVPFKANGHTVRDYEERFMQEAEGIFRPNDRRFRWEHLNGDVQLNWF
jgi:hypothetical protein